ncbi:LPXTG cell wall anchor domain-containing protein [Streptomyces sp. NPDC058401]|uniref:LPXTG cell wall anchor domain-containing protein n=1 Tax=Streptomyces sp. NPDC058401 TaxID=3346480 RepID=UPI0036626030
MRPTSLPRIAAGGSVLALAALAATAAGAAAPSARAADGPHAERRVQVVMVNFTDSEFPDPAGTTALLKKAYFAQSGSLASYYNEVTRGATTFEPAAAEGGILGPIDLPMAGAGCDSGKISDLTYKALEARGIAKSAYEHVSIVFPNQKTHCSYLALGSVGGGTTWLPIDGKDISMSALVHEFGHNFGYSHHMRQRCEQGALPACTGTDVVSGKTPMGGGGWEVGLSSPELIHNSWLPGTELAKVTKSATYTLRPLYGQGSGVRALDIPLGEDRLVIELRASSGTLDHDLKGVHAYRVPKGDYRRSVLIDTTKLDHHPDVDRPAPDADALKAGSVLTDAGAKVEVKVLATDPDEGTARVSVALGGIPAPAPAPTKAPAASSAAPAAPSAKAPEPSADVPGTQTPGSSVEVPETGALATTGGGSASRTLAIAGAALAALGAAFLLRVRRRTTTAALSPTPRGGRHRS